MMQRVLLLLTLAAASCEAFAPATHSRSVATQLQFGIPSFGAKDDEKEDEEELPPKQIGMKGLLQLVTAGLGSPFLGDYEGVDEETGKFMFSLEANNLVDEVRYNMLCPARGGYLLPPHTHPTTMFSHIICYYCCY